jgi:hypothetical protein
MKCSFSAYGRQPSQVTQLISLASFFNPPGPAHRRRKQSVGGTPPHASGSSSDTKVGVWLPPPADLQGKAPQKHWNATALAYLGDSVWEVRPTSAAFVRTC